MLPPGRGPAGHAAAAAADAPSLPRTVPRGRILRGALRRYKHRGCSTSFVNHRDALTERFGHNFKQLSF